MDYLSNVLAIARNLVAHHVGRTGPTRGCYLAITEGRGATDAPFGWCGEFVTACLEWGGGTDGSALNRVSLNGRWAPGDNITRLSRWGTAHGVLLPGTSTLGVLPGYVYCMDVPHGGHVGLVSDVVASDRFASLDGNSIGGVCASNGRSCSAGPNPRVLWFLDPRSISTGSRIAVIEGGDALADNPVTGGGDGITLGLL